MHAALRTDDGARQTDDGLLQTDDGARRTDDRLLQTDDGAPQTDDGARQTDDRLLQTVTSARVINAPGGVPLNPRSYPDVSWPMCDRRAKPTRFGPRTPRAHAR